MKTEKRRWRPSPAIVVLTMALAVIAGLLGVGWLNARRYRVNARVEIAEPDAATEVSTTSPSTLTASLPDGEVARMAMRIREAAGLLMGLTVLSVSEQISYRHPARVEALIELMAQRDIFPPSVSQASAKGALVSDRATIYVRYRPRPFGMAIPARLCLWRGESRASRCRGHLHLRLKSRLWDGA